MRRFAIVLLVITGCSSDYVDDAEERSGLECSERDRCNGIVAVDCQASTDGPLYYYDERSVTVISVCGGACFTPDPVKREECRTMCPPPAWTCD